MPSRAASYMAAGAGACAASTAFTSVAGTPALRSAHAASSADLRVAGAATQQSSQMPTAMLALGAVAAMGVAAQAGKRGARRSVKACAVATLDRATLQEVEKAKADFEMKKWAAEKLAAEGAPQAAVVAQNAAAAEAKWKALEEQATGAAPATPSYTPPAAAAPVAAPTPVAAAPTGAPSRELLEEVKKAKADYEMKKWAADKLASEGAPQAAMVAQNAAAAEAKWKALEEQASGAAPATPAYTPPAAAAGLAAPAVSGAPTPEEVKKAKDDFELKKWAAEKLARDGAPQAATVAEYAATAEALWKALEEKLSGAAPSTPAYTAPVVAAAPAAAASAPAAVAFAASLPDAASADLEKAKEQADLLTWAYEKLAAEGAPQAAMMKSKADQAVATYNALLNN